MASKAVCINCHDPKKPIHAKGQCSACYMKHKRDTNPFTEAGRARKYAKEVRRMRSNLVRILNLIEETTCFTPEEAATVEAFTRAVTSHLQERLDSMKARLEVVK